MDAERTRRLAAKESESAIVARIGEDFNLTPVLARAHYEQMARYFAEFGQVPERPGEVCYLAVAATEPAGKPLRLCRKVEVRLELTAPEDLEAAEQGGVSAMRRGRLMRLTRQARVEGALLTIEDLAYLLTTSVSTVRRDLSDLRSVGEEAPTRGMVRDIGPGISHKARVIQLYLWGFQFTDIESQTGHSEEAISRYLKDFRQVAALYARGATTAEIRAATGHSARLIGEYVGLYERARREFPSAPRLRDLLEPAKAKKGGAE